MNRLTFYDIRNSRIPAAIGECASNTPALASYVNEAQQRLIQASGEQGWVGSWAKMVFNASRANPYVTTPSNVARLSEIAICRQPMRIQNEFYEFLEFGRGLQRPDPSCGTCSCNGPQAYDRGFFPTLVDLVPGNKIRLYFTDAADAGKRLFFNAVDSNGLQIYTLDNGVQMNGFFLTMGTPFVDSLMALNSIAGIQKDTTLGPVSIYQVDATTGAQTLLTTLSPTDSSPSYRRYFLGGLPQNCPDCDSVPGVIQVTAMAKLDFVPVVGDTDYLIIQNIPALKKECQAIRLEEIDGGSQKQEAMFYHKLAIQLLNQEIDHFEGKSNPAIRFSPFGNATLNRAGVGMT
jgi:hypothetical protein